MVSERSDGSNIFNVSGYDEAYWESYLKARPKYSSGEFYSKVLAYHEKHSGLSLVAHDVGTGPGQVAAVLSDHFEDVVASDFNQAHLDVCKHRMSSGKGNISFVLCPGEEISSHVPASSADAVFSGEALALMDTEKALSSFARILKPDGTLAVWYYGRPLFMDAGCQNIYDKIVNTLFGAIIKGGGPSKTKQWKRTTDIMASWFDNVRFEELEWKHVERYKWNTDGKMTFYDEEACDFAVDVSSTIGENEKVFEATDRALWAGSWNVGEVKQFVHVNLPGFAARGLLESPSIERLFEELAAAMSGDDTKHTIAWPVVLLLATKT